MVKSFDRKSNFNNNNNNPNNLKNLEMQNLCCDESINNIDTSVIFE